MADAALSAPRFQVRIVHGRMTQSPVSNRKADNLSAHVLDRAYAWRVVRTFRSERGIGSRHRLGCEGAIAAAEEHAATLNKLYPPVRPLELPRDRGKVAAVNGPTTLKQQHHE